VDSSPRIDVSLFEPVVDRDDGQSQFLTFYVSLSEDYDQAVTVQYQTVDGFLDEGYADGAAAGEDYVATSGTLTFDPGETVKTFTVEVLGDTTPEYDEFFSVYLFGASGGMIEYGWADGWIYGALGTPPGEFGQ
jgi:hypothetical protein